LRRSQILAAALAVACACALAGRSPATAADARAPLLAAVERLWAEIDLAEIEPQALQAELGSDPEALRRHVAGAVRFEAYPGALRGARGALLAGAGNARDRALLLAALLRAAGHRVRFAFGELDAAAAERLVRSGLAASGPPGTDVEGAEILAEAVERAEDLFLLLGDALHDAGCYAPAGDTRGWEESVKEARHHVWVEVEESGGWTALDPSPGAAAGSALARADRTAEELPAEDFYSFEVRLEIELTVEGKSARNDVLVQSFRAADLAGEPLGLYFEDQGGKAQPHLVAGERLIRGEPFVTAPPSDGFFPLPGVGRQGPSPVTGIRIHFKIEGPGGRREVASTVFTARSGSAGAAKEAEGDVTSRGPATAEEALASVIAMTASVGPVPASLVCARFLRIAGAPGAETAAAVLGCFGLSCLSTRAGLPDTLLLPGARVYADFPGALVVVARPSGRAGAVDLTVDWTLRAERILRAPEDPLGPAALFHDRIASSVLAHTAERLVTGAEDAQGSVGGLFEAARAEGLALRVVKPGEPPPAGWPFGAAGAALARGEIERGRAIVFPERAPAGWQPGLLGWWSIDATNGEALDSTEMGGHSSASERGVQEKEGTCRNPYVVAIISAKVLFKVAIPVAVLMGAPHELKDLAKQLDPILKQLERDFCRPGLKPKLTPTPGGNRFPPRPPNPRNPGPNPFKNPPASRWPPGAPRGR
jgi:hypothetical protein